MPVIDDPKLERLVTTLHAQSDAQIPLMMEDRAQREARETPPGPEALKAFVRDKLVALDRDKAEFCYLLCRANNARRVVEAGTSYGVSTLYLAAAIRDNVRATGG